MQEPKNYLQKYRFNWNIFNVIAGKISPIDSVNLFEGIDDIEDVSHFLESYGIETTNPVEEAELFGNFQESLQFIRRYFLGTKDEGKLEIRIPSLFYQITDVKDLFLIAVGQSELTKKRADSLWSSIIIKIMHTLLHIDKDLRTNYFSHIQQQILDRFYRCIKRNEKNELCFYDQFNTEYVPIERFEVKSRKSRESTLLKLLAKPENIADELFDRIGVRLVTQKKFDVLRLIKILYQNNIIIPHNIKTSRSRNSLIEIENFKDEYFKLLKSTMRDKVDEDQFLQSAEKIIDQFRSNAQLKGWGNKYTNDNYRAIHFTCRQIVGYRDPIVSLMFNVRDLSKKRGDQDPELKKLLGDIDKLKMKKKVRFFYPYELQITDKDGHEENSKGEASHEKYKEAQRRGAQDRLFKNLLDELSQY